MKANKSPEKYLSKKPRAKPRSRTKKKRTQKSKKNQFSFLKFLLKSVFNLTVISFVIISVILAYYYHDLPDIANLDKNNNSAISVLNSDNSKMVTFGELYGDDVMFSQVSRHLIDAVIATEDRNFFKHSGIDIKGIIRAMIANYKHKGYRQGGSTITQQLAKISFLKPNKTIRRKIQEIMLSIQLEKIFSKEQIITMYLNRVYFGAGNYGINSASKFYFKKSPEELNIEESAMLVGLLKAPSKYSPINNPQLTKKRTEIVLYNMVDAGYLSKKFLRNLDQVKTKHEQKYLQNRYFANWIKDQIIDYIGYKYRGEKISIVTTLDKKAQMAAEKATDWTTRKYPKTMQSSQIALIAMKNDGAILAMIGGKDYLSSQFNRSTEAKRQTGSLAKIFPYLNAFENGANTDDIYEDKPIAIDDWTPKNYNNKYFGKVTLKEAFAKSLNSIVIQLVEDYGSKESLDLAAKMGITANFDYKDMTMFLGSFQASLLEMTTAYAVVANNGFAVVPYAIRKIINDDKEEILYKRISSGKGKILSDYAINQAKISLKATIEEGSGKAAMLNDVNVYGKTGTTQNNRDAWFIGFTDDIIVGIWIGNDDNSPTLGVTGGSIPAITWKKFMNIYLQK